MHFLITRTSKTPNSPLVVVVDSPKEGTPFFGVSGGGGFEFQPNGQDGDSAQVDEYVAGILMGDPGNAEHFSCEPPFQAAGDPDGDAAGETSQPGAPKKQTGKRKAAAGDAAATADGSDE
jgi:hypothetical protein